MLKIKKQAQNTSENPAFLNTQLINYLGNKRALLEQICAVLEQIKDKLGAKKISFADVFSGSGSVARAAKAHSNLILANDLEGYSHTINSCYLSNFTPELGEKIDAFYKQICADFSPQESFLSRLYAPRDDADIKAGERVFYSRKNALILGGLRAQIDKIPPEFRHFFIAPLLSEASIHSNTGGVFKGFYKGKNGVGKIWRRRRKRAWANFGRNFAKKAGIFKFQKRIWRILARCKRVCKAHSSGRCGVF